MNKTKYAINVSSLFDFNHKHEGSQRKFMCVSLRIIYIEHDEAPIDLKMTRRNASFVLILRFSRDCKELLFSCESDLCVRLSGLRRRY